MVAVVEIVQGAIKDPWPVRGRGRRPEIETRWALEDGQCQMKGRAVKQNSVPLRLVLVECLGLTPLLTLNARDRDSKRSIQD